jgi:N-carbamoylputrescine amidase
MENLKITAVGFHSQAGNTESNLIATEKIIKKACIEQPDIIFFPETALTGYSSSNNIFKNALEVPCRETEFIKKLSKKYSTTIVTGFHEKRNNKYHISQMVVFNGETLGIYRKTHLSYSESKILSPGNTIPVFEHPKCRFGIQLCYDTHFPELSIIQSIKKADILFMAFATPGKDSQAINERLMRFLQARAYDNSCFLVYANLYGTGAEGQFFCGVTGFIDPKGHIIANNLSDKNELLTIELFSHQIKKIRNSRMGHFLNHRRKDIYKLSFPDDDL